MAGRPSRGRRLGVTAFPEPARPGDSIDVDKGSSTSTSRIQEEARCNRWAWIREGPAAPPRRPPQRTPPLDAAHTRCRPDRHRKPTRAAKHPPPLRHGTTVRATTITPAISASTTYIAPEHTGHLNADRTTPPLVDTNGDEQEYLSGYLVGFYCYCPQAPAQRLVLSPKYASATLNR